MNQKEIGNMCEYRLLSLLRKKGWWCHLFAYNTNGQPCDIIALKNNVGILIDVKHCSTDKFDTSRIEPNQKMCFEYAKSCGVNYTGFAIDFDSDDGIFRWLPYGRVANEKTINKLSLCSLEVILDEIIRVQ